MLPAESLLAQLPPSLRAKQSCTCPKGAGSHPGPQQLFLWQNSQMDINQVIRQVWKGVDGHAGLLDDVERGGETKHTCGHCRPSMVVLGMLMDKAYINAPAKQALLQFKGPTSIQT